MPTSATTETADNLSITGNNLYLRWTTSVSSSTGSNRDFQLDDIVITYTTYTDPVINAGDVNITHDAESGSISYTLTNGIGNVTAVVTTGSDWLTLGTITSSAVPFTCSANNSQSDRTATVTLSYTGADDKVVTVTQRHQILDYATLPFSFDGGKSDIETTSGLTQNGLSADYASSPKLKFDGTGDYVILRLNEAPGTLTYDILGYGFSSGSTSTFKVQTSADGETYTDLETYTELGDTQHESFAFNANVRYIKWIYAEKGSTNGGNVALGNIKVNYESVSVSTVGYGTYASDNALDFTNSSIKAYYATLDGSTLTFHKVNKVPANTGVLLYKAGGATEYVPMLTGSADDVTGNVFVRGAGTSLTYEDNNKVYVLQVVNNVVGFYRANNNGVATNRAYVQVPANVNGVKAFTFNFDDLTTGVNAVDHGQLTIDNGAIYNLSGQRLSKPAKGINIINGKKVIVK